METNGKFYLGRIFDAQKGETTADPLLYDPNDLTTHGVIVGMTGSGKTGLCLDLMEEAALNDIPALMIDPKGDITNALLHFPDMLPSDFKPWINAEEARRDGKTVDEASADTAAMWKNGLAKWGIHKERIQALKDGTAFTVFTPGSDAGVSISILSSFACPSIPWEENKELLRERVAGTVTAVLGLIGLNDIDPVRSREHILLSNIFEHAWSAGKDLDLSELIMQTQAPPFEKLGVFPVDRFFPEKDRFDLAMNLNNILASPAFQSWIEGVPLDIPTLLYTADGKPRHSVFYIAHLSETERMFFVTLLFSTFETWMRSQAGSTSLRALLYFDEIFGYLPPISNPPSKPPMLRMLKQARAFGVGLVLATQNPVDIDYKALSNTGTWFIGKLQTERDKERLLDGLAGAATNMDRGAYDRLLSSLGKRVFLRHNVHEKEPVTFQTRWAMNYLAGPMTRARIDDLNKLAGVDEAAFLAPKTTPQPAAAAASVVAAAAAPAVNDLLASAGSQTRPSLPNGIGEYFLPHNQTFSQASNDARRPLPPTAKEVGMVYRPVLVAQADIRFNNRKYGINEDLRKAFLSYYPDPQGRIDWEADMIPALDGRSFDSRTVPEARFAPIAAPLDDSRTMKSLQSDFVDWAYRNVQMNARANETLKVYAGASISAEAFEDLCEEAADDKMEAQLKKIAAAFDRKIDSTENKLRREVRELEEDTEMLTHRKREEWGSHAETVLGYLGFGRKKSLTTALSKRRQTSRAEQEIEESEQEIEEMKRVIEELREERQEELEELKIKWDEIIDDVSEVQLTPYKKDILVDLFGVAWFPYYLVDVDGRLEELPAFAQETAE